MVVDSRLSYRKVVATSLIAVALSLLICIVSGLYYGFSKVTYTSCGSYEVLPSVSAAVDYNGFHRALWQMPITVHCLEHLLAILLSYRNHQASTVRISLHAIGTYSPWSGVLNLATAIADLASVTSLFSLSFFTSTLYFIVHKNSVVVFMLVTTLHMALATYQLWSRNGRVHGSQKEQRQLALAKKSLRVKLACLATNVVCISLGGYLYSRHHSYCRPYSYSMFAVCEYVVISSVLIFHYAKVWDLPRLHISLTYVEPVT